MKNLFKNLFYKIMGKVCEPPEITFTELSTEELKKQRELVDRFRWDLEKEARENACSASLNRSIEKLLKK